MSNITRRHFGVGLAGALITGSAFAAAPGTVIVDEPDAELLRIGKQFDMLIWQYLPIFRAWQGAMNEYGRQAHFWRERRLEPPEGFCALRMRLCEGPSNALDDLIKRLDGLSDAAQRIPVVTMRGLEVKARMLQWDLAIPPDTSIPFEAWDAEAKALYRFNRQVSGLATIII